MNSKSTTLICFLKFQMVLHQKKQVKEGMNTTIFSQLLWYCTILSQEDGTSWLLKRFFDITTSKTHHELSSYPQFSKITSNSFCLSRGRMIFHFSQKKKPMGIIDGRREPKAERITQLNSYNYLIPLMPKKKTSPRILIQQYKKVQNFTKINK